MKRPEAPKPRGLFPLLRASVTKQSIGQVHPRDYNWHFGLRECIMALRNSWRCCMRKIATALIVFWVFPAMFSARMSPGPQKSEPHMTHEERAKVIKLLDETDKQYLDAISNLTEAQWTYKPSPFKWSVGEVAEHIMLTEPALFSFLQRALAGKE